MHDSNIVVSKPLLDFLTSVLAMDETYGSGEDNMDLEVDFGMNELEMEMGSEVADSGHPEDDVDFGSESGVDFVLEGNWIPSTKEVLAALVKKRYS